MKTYSKGSDEFISKYFKAREFDCPCKQCLETLIDEDLPIRADVLRERLGSPLFITSGYRCPEHQTTLRTQGFETAPGISQHELGKAMDCQTHEHTGEEIELAARAVGFMSIGVGAHFCHLDLRADRKRRWTYSY